MAIPSAKRWIFTMALVACAAVAAWFALRGADGGSDASGIAESPVLDEAVVPAAETGDAAREAVVEDEAEAEETHAELGPSVPSLKGDLPPLTGDYAQRVIDFNNAVTAFERDAAAFRDAHPVYGEIAALLRDRWAPVMLEIELADYELDRLGERGEGGRIGAAIGVVPNYLRQMEDIVSAIWVADFAGVMQSFDEQIVKSGAVELTDDNFGHMDYYRRWTDVSLPFLKALTSGAEQPFPGMGERQIEMYEGAAAVLREGVPDIDDVFADNELAHKAFLRDLGEAYPGAVDFVVEMASVLPEDLAGRYDELHTTAEALTKENGDFLSYTPWRDRLEPVGDLYSDMLRKELAQPAGKVDTLRDAERAAREEMERTAEGLEESGKADAE